MLLVLLLLLVVVLCSNLSSVQASNANDESSLDHAEIDLNEDTSDFTAFGIDNDMIAVDHDLIVGELVLMDEAWHQTRRIAESRALDYGGRHPFEILDQRRKMRALWDETVTENAMDREAERTDTSSTVRMRGVVQEARESVLSQQEYKPLRFSVITDFLDSLASTQSKYRDVIQIVKQKILPEAIGFWSRALSVFPVSSPILVNRPCPYRTKDRTIGIDGTDLVVYILANRRGCEDNNVTLAYAANCQVDQYDRPTVGFAVLCLDNISSNNITTNDRSQQQITEIIIHEIAHVLGQSAFDLPYFYDPNTGLPRTSRPLKSQNFTCVDGIDREVYVPANNTIGEGVTKRGARYFEIVTDTVRNVVRNQFNCQNMTGARLENQPTNAYSCFGSHWESRLFYSERMAASLGYTPKFISPLTLALLQDSGWYKANFSISSISPFGHGAGCDFVYDDCIVNGTVPSYSEDFFCNDTYEEAPLVCGPTHRYISRCDLTNYTDGEMNSTVPPPPLEYQYFPDPEMGAKLYLADYCPTITRAIPLENDTIFDSGTDCYDTNLTSNFTVEYFGEESRCFNTDGIGRPLCLRSRCNEERHAVEVLIGDSVVLTCEENGQMIDIPETPGTRLKCPLLAVICPDLICPGNCGGRGICDYSLPDPECVCFNETDTSPMCENSLSFSQTSPPTWAPSESPSESAEISSPAPSVTGGSLAPSIAGGSLAPSTTGESLAPSTTGASLVPSTTGGSLAPSTMGASLAPSTTGVSLAPSTTGGSLAPSTTGGSLAPSTMGASLAPSMLSVGPSTSAPSAVTSSSSPSLHLSSGEPRFAFAISLNFVLCFMSLLGAIR